MTQDFYNQVATKSRAHTQASKARNVPTDTIMLTLDIAAHTSNNSLVPLCGELKFNCFL